MFQMKTSRVGISLSVLFWVFMASSVSAKTNPDFEKLKSLLGTWQADMGQERTVEVSYELVSRNTAILERQVLPGAIVTVTVYHLDGESIRLSHFCGSGTHPRMELSSRVDTGEMRFTEVDVANLPHRDAGYMSGIGFVFDSDSSFTQKITWKQGGLSRETALQYVKVQ